MTALRFAGVLAVLLLLSACASDGEVTPESVESNPMDRVQVQEVRGVTVRTTVPSAKESEALFDLPLYRRGIQPVWLEITNASESNILFLPVGLDPGYFTPVEAANRAIRLESVEKRNFINEQRLFRQGMQLLVEPGETRSGYLFTELDEGTKAFNVDLLSDEWFESLTFFVPVPGLRVDHYQVDWQSLYPPDDIQDLDTDALVTWLESQHCCVTSEAGDENGDPLNLVIIGNPNDLYVAFIRAGWDETETITAGTSWKTVKSFIGGGEYRYSPVSALYVFGRAQDVAFQKARDNIHERNHLRLWMTPVRYEGKPVWIGQISRDIGVRFTKKTITTHKIDPDVDETREYLLEDLAYAQSLKQFSYVGGVGLVPINAPKGNLTGDPWFSDGHRAVLWVSSEPVDIHEIRVLPWRHPLDNPAH